MPLATYSRGCASRIVPNSPTISSKHSRAGDDILSLDRVNQPQIAPAGVLRMNVLFVHNNFPAQYRHVARALARDPSMRIAAIGATTARNMNGVDLRRYALTGADVTATHPFARRFDFECQRAEQVLYALSSLSRSTYPQEFHDKISVIHEGVDTAVAKPEPTATLRLASGRELHRTD
jgi:hypothetical protein